PKAKAEEPKKAAPAPAAKPPAETKPAPASKAAPDTAAASKKGKVEPAPASKKGGRADSEPGSRKPASLRAVRDGEVDDLDASSISAEFFRKDGDSLPPVEEHDLDHGIESVAAPVLSPATLARRARLRRLVAGVVAFAGVLSIAV